MLEQPEYPAITWELCEKPEHAPGAHEATHALQHPCLSLENAKKLGLYLRDVQRYHESIKHTCGG